MMHPLQMTAAEAARFDQRYRKDESGCWLWNGSTSGGGYGSFAVGGRQQRAHRVSLFRSLSTDLGGGFQAAHSCGVRACVNPAHLRWATVRENAGDMVAHGTRRKGMQIVSARLDEKAVREMRSLVGKGQCIEDVAAKFSVTTAAAYNAVRGRTWGHVPGAIASKQPRLSGEHRIAVRVTFTEDEYAAVKVAAKECHQDPYFWLRILALEAVGLVKPIGASTRERSLKATRGAR